MGFFNGGENNELGFLLLLLVIVIVFATATDL